MSATLLTPPFISLFGIFLNYIGFILIKGKPFIMSYSLSRFESLM